MTNIDRWIKVFSKATVALLAFLVFSWSNAFLSESQADDASPIERWGVFELSIKGPSSGNPYLDVNLSAEFTQDDVAFEASGFYDGDGVYRVRFMPPTEGIWRYTTQSDVDALNGLSGQINVDAPSPKNHGPVRIASVTHFAYEDGTPYFQVGTTCYAWIHQPDELRRQTLETLAGAPFNKIRFCIFPKSYTYNQNEPERFAFQKNADGSFDFDRPDPLFWRDLEQRLLDLQRLGIEADIILWHPYDRWGFSEMNDEQDDRYLRYCIARLGAHRNVWWSLANEFDLMAAGVRNHRGNKTMDDWDRFFQILEAEDPYAHLRSIHNCREFYDHSRSWVTHASIQRHDLPSVYQWRQDYAKPIVVDECGYEGNVPMGWGNLTPQEMTRRFWIGAIRGGSVGHGETYEHPEDILWWSKGGVLHGESPARITFMRDLLSRYPLYELEPDVELAPGVYPLSKQYGPYLVYFTEQTEATIETNGPGDYKIDGVDTWNMQTTSLGDVPAGSFTFTPPCSDYLLILTPYIPGEVRRPRFEASITPSSGEAPLTVACEIDSNLPAVWEFDDERTVEGRAATHLFSDSGLHSVRVTVRDGDALTTKIFTIPVEGNVNEPIVRTGYPSEDLGQLRLEGRTVQTETGTWTLPNSEPWSRILVGDGPIDDLNGLRSFTILAWGRPSTLKQGMGGNRIVFCLQHRSSGFDLVHHADGRLRLAVNEWPDRVQNDSSAGQLREGEWTFFAVSYDATKSEENVRWYFGDEQSSATLDRVTTYNNGPTGGNVADLAVGNFNPTMDGYGLDRQFRGSLRGIEIYGSRIGEAGALPLDRIIERQEENAP